MLPPKYINLSTAASVLGVSIADLDQMILAGIIKAVEIDGEVIVSKISVFSFQKGRKVQPISIPTGELKKKELPEYKKFSHLAGKIIWLSEAARKYAINYQNIQRWVSKGYIQVLGTEKNRVLLDEQDVAYCVDIYRQAREKGYRWIFYSDGTPYSHLPRQKKHC